MTKTKAVAIIFILAIAMLISAFGITNARYSSTVEVDRTIDYARIIGKLALYDPQSVESFPEDKSCYDASEQCFRICASKPGCDNIKFSISNTVTKNDVEYTNGVITDCFVRIVPDTPDGTIPVDYLVYRQDRIADVDGTPTVDDADKYGSTDVGGTPYYGGADFKLSTDKKDPFIFSMQVSWKKKTVKDENGNDVTSLDSATLGMHSCKVQLVRKKIRSNENDPDTYYVLDEVLLKLRFDVEVDYYEIGGGEDGLPKLAESKLMVFNVDETADFKKNIPAGYIFKRATSAAWGWADAPDGVKEITDDLADYPVQVVCLKDGVVTVTVDYRDRSSPVEYGAEGSKYVVFDLVKEDVLQIDKSAATTIDFNDPDTLAAVGIALPDITYETVAADGTKTIMTYRSEYVAANCSVDAWRHTWTDNDVNSSTYGREDCVFYQDSVVIPANTEVNEMTLLVYIAPVKKYTIQATISDSATGNLKTVTFTTDEQGDLTLTQAQLRGMDDSFSAKSSFTIYYKNNLTSSSLEVGNVVNGDVHLNCFTLRQFEGTSNVWYDNGFCLANPRRTSLYIIIWW